MGLKRILLFTGLLGATAGAATGALTGVGAEPLNQPQGISLRETSLRDDRQAGFFHRYHRTHRGGGLRGGK